MIKSLTTAQLQTLSKDALPKDSVILNVCTQAEYAEEHIANSLNIPLQELPQRINELKTYHTVYVHCRSGRRSLEAAKILGEQTKADVYNVEGGLISWKENSFSTQKNTNRLPIIRQVFISASVLLWLSLAGFYFVSAWFLVVIAIVASGLLLSGVTGWCGMALLLAKMPWNKK